MVLDSEEDLPESSQDVTYPSHSIVGRNRPVVLDSGRYPRHSIVGRNKQSYIVQRKRNIPIHSIQW